MTEEHHLLPCGFIFLATCMLLFMSNPIIDMHLILEMMALGLLQYLGLKDLVHRTVPLGATFATLCLWGLMAGNASFISIAGGVSGALLVGPYLSHKCALMGPIDGLMLATLALGLDESQLPVFLMGTGIMLILFLKVAQQREGPLLTCAWAAYLFTFIF